MDSIVPIVLLIIFLVSVVILRGLTGQVVYVCLFVLVLAAVLTYQTRDFTVLLIVGSVLFGLMFFGWMFWKLNGHRYHQGENSIELFPQPRQSVRQIMPTNNRRPPCDICQRTNHVTHECRLRIFTKQRKPRCQNCNMTNHMTHECRLDSGKFPGRCWTCNVYGHKERDCNWNTNR